MSKLTRISFPLHQLQESTANENKDGLRKGGLRAVLPLVGRRYRALEAGVGRFAERFAAREFKVRPHCYLPIYSVRFTNGPCTFGFDDDSFL